MTQFMSNVVTITLLMPIIIADCTDDWVFPSALLMVLCIASTMSILSPICVSPANLIYAYGGGTSSGLPEEQYRGMAVVFRLRAYL